MENKKTRIKLIYTFEADIIKEEGEFAYIEFDKIPDLNKLLCNTKLNLINETENVLEIKQEVQQ